MHDVSGGKWLNPEARSSRIRVLYRGGACAVAALAAIVLALTVGARGQDGSTLVRTPVGSEPPPISSPAASEFDQRCATEGELSVVETLLRLRRALGSPIDQASIAAGATEEDFIDALRRIAISSRQHDHNTRSESLAPETGARREPTGSVLAGGFKSQIIQLRLIARQLEQCAADLEDLARYADADDLRHLAARLRQAARPPYPEAEQAAREAAEHALQTALRRE